MSGHIVVVGSGAAGVAAAETLRTDGFTGTVTLLGAEPGLPYDRPPLSKHVLSGQWDTERTVLYPARHFDDLDITRVHGRAVGLDIDARLVHRQGAAPLAYDGLVIATGVVPRRLPFGDGLAGVHVLRDTSDTLALRAQLQHVGTRLLVIGAGFLGAEAAAVARGLGREVTLVDPLPHPLSPLGPVLGARVAELHRANGVRLRTSTKVVHLHGDGGHVTGATLDDGSAVAADCVLVAIGSRPAVDWLASSGLSLTDGVDCDAYCRAAPDVYAAGDVASWPHPRYGRRMRLEHRMNATEQGTAAARNLLGAEPAAFAPLPSFWSDQYDVKIQAYGDLPPGADVTAVEGTLDADRFVAAYRTGGRTTGVLAWNAARAVRPHHRQLAEEHLPPAASSPARSTS
ncbi:NAD(P)/FAD-dependent oxidoreductase [Streptomyces sp. NPDC059629]|uniref:NAD(P)/FAD-dependent oxidoreductase n=1 Tax=Streptomyces sp. NPDC059629 TaxID=3346889 RepID=UPI00368BBEDE